MVGMNTRTTILLNVAAFAVVASVFSAWHDPSSDDALTPRPDDSQPIIFPVQDPANNVMQALIEGTLTERGRCLHISGRELYKWVLPIWPDGFSYERADGTLSVLNPNGKTVAATGSSVSMGGGMFGEDGAPLPSLLRARVGPCDGPYWIVGEISESS